MSQAPVMPVFPDALLGDTLHLSAEEFGAYCLLLLATWRNNGVAFADDDRKLARICRVTVRRWQQRLRPVLIQFFQTDDHHWHQKRLEKEWQFVAQSAAISRSNGAKGGRPKLLNGHKSGNPAGSVGETQKEPAHTHTHNHTSVSKEDTAGCGNGHDDLAAEVFTLGVRILTRRGVPDRQARSILGGHRKALNDDGRLLAILASVEHNNPIEPISYLARAVKEATKPFPGWMPNEGVF